MKNDAIIGGYYILKDYSSEGTNNRIVYEVLKIDHQWFSMNNNDFVNYVFYNYYDLHGRKLGYNSMELRFFSDLIVTRVKPRNKIWK